jgi:hypothetical protein
MDQQHISSFTRSMTRVPSRREVLRGLAGAALGLGVARPPELAAAKKRTKKAKKPKTPKPNAYGCLNVGAVCKNGDQCCSGVCEGKTCRAHHAGICRVDYDLCTTGAGHLCGIVNEVGANCACVLTTGNAPFCGDFSEGTTCRECNQDADCEEEFGPGAACVVMAAVCEGFCADTGDTACQPPCSKPAK